MSKSCKRRFWAAPKQILLTKFNVLVHGAVQRGIATAPPTRTPHSLPRPQTTQD